MTKDIGMVLPAFMLFIGIVLGFIYINAAKLYKSHRNMYAFKNNNTYELAKKYKVIMPAVLHAEMEEKLSKVSIKIYRDDYINSS